MATTKVLGKVSLTLGGDYSDAVSYSRLTMVLAADGKGYVSKQDNTVGIEPAVTAGWENYWQLITERGAGVTSIQKTASGETSDTYTIYYENGTTSTYQAENGKGYVADVTRSLGDDFSIMTGAYSVIDGTGWTNGKYLKNDGSISNVADMKVMALTAVPEGSYTLAIRATSPFASQAMRFCGYDGSGTFVRLLGNFAAPTAAGVLKATINTTGCAQIRIAAGLYDAVAVYAGESIIEKVSAIDATLIDKAPAIMNTTESSAIASFPDGAAGLPMALTVGIEPVQDLHGQANPWPAGGGKNKLPFGTTQTINMVTFTVASNGAVTVSGTATANAGFDIGRNITTLPAGSYYLSVHSTTTNVTYTLFKDVSGGVSAVRYGEGAFTLDSDTSVFLRMAVTSGNAASGVAYPMIESGSTATTYAPYSNICPITGWTGCNVVRTGKNLLRYPYDVTSVTVDGLTITDVGDGTVRLNGSRTSTTYFNMTTTDAPVLLKAGSYRIAATGDSNVQFNWYKVGATTISTGYAERTFTLTEDTMVYYFLRINGGASFSNVTVKPMLLLASDSVPTAYAPYTGTTLPVSFPSSAGTVYGGTLRIERDGSGTLTVDKHFIAPTSCSSVSTASTGVKYANIGLPAGMGSPGEALSNRNMSSVYKFAVAAPQTPGWFRVLSNVLFIFDDRFTDKATADGILATEQPQFVYKLATPLDPIPLTPGQVLSILGDNRVWADCGPTKAEYAADTKLFIEQRIAELQALVLENIGG